MEFSNWWIYYVMVLVILRGVVRNVTKMELCTLSTSGSPVPLRRNSDGGIIVHDVRRGSTNGVFEHVFKNLLSLIY